MFLWIFHSIEWITFLNNEFNAISRLDDEYMNILCSLCFGLLQWPYIHYSDIQSCVDSITNRLAHWMARIAKINLLKKHHFPKIWSNWMYLTRCFSAYNWIKTVQFSCRHAILSHNSHISFWSLDVIFSRNISNFNCQMRGFCWNGLLYVVGFFKFLFQQQQ